MMRNIPHRDTRLGSRKVRPLSLFRTEYPESYAYFRTAIEGELRMPDADDEERATLTKALSVVVELDGAI